MPSDDTVNFTDADLFLAYRHAKLALYQEHGVGRLDIAEAERNLAALLQRVRRGLTKREGWFSAFAVGTTWVLPKKAHVLPRPRAVARIADDGPATIERIDIRLHLQPSVEFAITEVLWLWSFGPALELLLSHAARANRLWLAENGKAVDRLRRGPFRFWPAAYEKFREQGLAAARDCLNGVKRACVVATLDFANYYDELDPNFLLSGDFVAQVTAKARAQRISFDPGEYVRATRTLLDAFHRFQLECQKITGVPTARGIPIGSLVSKVVANLALGPLDDHVLERPSLSYYARYVDDIFLVDSATESVPDDSIELIKNLLPFRAQTAADGIELLLDSGRLGRSGSEFKLRESKLRTFNLRGKRGRDFLGAIARDLRMIGSERRVFLYSEGHGTESRLTGLVVGTDAKKPVQVLRDVDRLKLEKYAASVVISKAAAAVELLSQREAAKWCRTRLGSLADVASDPDHWVDFLDLGFRILGVSLRARDGRTAAALFRRYDRRLRALQGRRSPALVWNDRPVPRHRARHSLVRWLLVRRLEEVCAAVPLVRGSKGIARLDRSLENVLTAGERRLGAKVIARRALSLLRADLRTTDRETDLADARPVDVPEAASWAGVERSANIGEGIRGSFESAHRFLEVCRTSSDHVFTGMSPARLLLLTRPPTVFDIAYRWARAGRNVEELTDIINGLRGTHYSTGMITQPDDQTIDVSSYPLPTGWATVKDCWVVLGNLETEGAWLDAALRGRPKTPERRLEAVKQIINQARDRKRRHNRDTLLVLPELSLPRSWLRELAARLLADDIGLIVGLEYEPQGPSVVNEAVGVFPAGPFRSAAVCIWQKTWPAFEEASLLSKRNLIFRAPSRDQRKVVKTDYAALSVLICSELLDIKRRGELLGRTDLIVVPAWNRDTSTFDHTVQTTAGDLHCFVAVANNAQFSDCRVYVPAKERYDRDACRLISTGENETVNARLRVSDLRRFQLASLGRLSASARIRRLFKPIPPGYEYRRP